MEAVASIVGRAEMISALFFILGLVFYLKASQIGRKMVSRCHKFLSFGSKYPLIAFCCCFWISVLSKETGEVQVQGWDLS